MKQDKCLHKYRVENKVSELCLDETGFISNNITNDDRDCLYCCNGYNYNCFNYINQQHIDEFDQVFEDFRKNQDKCEISYLTRLTNGGKSGII